MPRPKKTPRPNAPPPAQPRRPGEERRPPPPPGTVQRDVDTPHITPPDPDPDPTHVTDRVEEASRESFPASDPPGRGSTGG